MLPQIPQWYLLEKCVYSISESSKRKHLTVSSALGVRAKLLVCSPLLLCSLFPNVIVLLHIFLELSDKMDWAKVPDSDKFFAWTCNFSSRCSSWLFPAFWASTQAINFYLFIHWAEKNIVSGQEFSYWPWNLPLILLLLLNLSFPSMYISNLVLLEFSVRPVICRSCAPEIVAKYSPNLLDSNV